RHHPEPDRRPPPRHGPPPYGATRAHFPRAASYLGCRHGQPDRSLRAGPRAGGPLIGSDRGRPLAPGGRSASFLDERPIVRAPTTLPRRHRGYVALVGLTLAALLLAAPGPRAVPATVAGKPEWLLGIFGRGF